MASKPRFKIVLSREFDKRFSKLPRGLQLQVLARMRELENDPHFGKTLKGTFRGLESLRVGKWRVIYQVMPAEQSVYIVTIKHRKEAYRAT